MIEDTLLKLIAAIEENTAEKKRGNDILVGELGACDTPTKTEPSTTKKKADKKATTKKAEPEKVEPEKVEPEKEVEEETPEETETPEPEKEETPEVEAPEEEIDYAREIMVHYNTKCKAATGADLKTVRAEFKKAFATSNGAKKLSQIDEADLPNVLELVAAI